MRSKYTFGPLLLRLLGFCIVLFSLASCVSSVEPEVAVNKGLQEDSPYYEAYQRHSRKARVLKDFEHRFTISATYLSDDMLGAIAARRKRLFDQTDLPFLADAKGDEKSGGKTSFLVSVYSPVYEQLDLKDKDGWSLLLKTLGGSQIGTKKITSLTDKLALMPYFESVDYWTKEFIVSFDTKDSPPSDLTLQIASADGKVTFKY